VSHWQKNCTVITVVVSALASINVVNRHWAPLVVTACGWVNHRGM